MRILVLFSLLIVISCSSISKKNVLPKDYQRPRHLIVLIHGLGGNYKHFGYLREALEVSLCRTDETKTYEVVNFDYDTNNNEKTIYDFADDLELFLQNYFKETAPLVKRDKLSLVMHSQGGLVGSIWLVNAFEQKSVLTANVHSLISLSTPYWGSYAASLGRKMKSYWYLPHGKRQLEELSFDSNTIYRFRRLLLEHPRPQGPIKVLNIGAIKASEDQDSDTVVDIPSMRLELLYLRRQDSDYDENQILPATQFQRTEISQFYLVDAVHLDLFSLFMGINSYPGVAQAYEECIKDSQCDHPTFQLLYNYFLDRPLLPRHLPQLEQFFLDFHLNVPESLNLKRDDIRIAFEQSETVEMEDELPPDYYQLPINPAGFRYHYHGRLFESPSKVMATISGPGLKSRKIEIKLEAGFASYVELNLRAN